ncbi:MAG: hypothetical protein E7649_01250 [Ruminococcaceae bacterium]|nr:hypothetical protein [Oscillospiraceae bacterium]
MKNTKNNAMRIVSSLSALLLLICLVASFTACNFYLGSNGNNAAKQEESTLPPPPQINVSDELDLPEYVQGLIQLDEIFNSYSYEGVDEQEMKKALLKAYIEATGDPYAEYLDAEEYEEYFSERSGEFVGIGVSVVNTQITINGYEYKVVQVISVFKDSPALEAGIRVGDCIMYVGAGESRELVDIIGYTEAVDRIKGEEGTLAEFTVFRSTAGSDYEELAFSIPRRKVESLSVNHRVSETDATVGIINITGFDDTTPRQFCAAVEGLKAQGCTRFVFDLRNNPGGGLDSIETVLSYFLSEGDLIVSIEYNELLSGQNYADHVREKHYTSEYAGLNVEKEDIGKYKDLDCVVLVNENSASAAELFTATFRDYSIAKIVGTRTFGKGSMQTLFSLDSYGMEGGLKLTVARYFSKSHTDYHGVGIAPDITVELSEEALGYNFFLLPEDKDNQLLAAIDELNK